MKKALFLVVLATLGTGCLQMQQASINTAADESLKALDAECKADMTTWCVMQYQLVENRRARDLDDASITAARRAQAFANLNRR